MRMLVRDPDEMLCDGSTSYKIIGGIWAAGIALTGGFLLMASRKAGAVPAFAQQTGQACKSCHVGGFGPELTPFGREFKLGVYNLSAHASIPIAAMAVRSFTYTHQV